MPSEDELDSKKTYDIIINQPDSIQTPKGMQWVQGKTFIKGAKVGDAYAMDREKPAHKVIVDGFFMDKTEVTNSEFEEFVTATGYVTVAERPINWEEMKKDLPQGTRKPVDSLLLPGSLVFNRNISGRPDMSNYGNWWTWKIGANWRHPQGPNSSIQGKEEYPVVHIAYEDALAYCAWKKRRLPTEAEWEAAAQGNFTHTIYTWGNDPEQLKDHANTWQGEFPIKSTTRDGFEYLAPVKSYPPNSIGLYDLLGNVWEWTSDIYNPMYYKNLEGDQPIVNPAGATEYYNPQNPFQEEMIIKGGSYLCHASYCASYRISARMSTSRDSGSDHVGFRTVVTPAMIVQQ
ncbi:formylglycine-generating enzyme family protein [Gangjinia marincola]|uniref:Formylglycine-generating enzyme family protein n=2 Tax=Gangjinia marincola TaxID=578463 RepID=A0ABN1MJE1_9FLAO